MSISSATVTGEAQASGAERAASLCAAGAGITGLLYSLSFLVLKNSLLSALFLMIGGLLAVVALNALYSRVRTIEETFARLALFLGVAGALGAMIHGGYDLANAINPPAMNFTLASLPSAIDPRGLLTFGAAGLGFAGFARLMGRSDQFSRPMSYLTYLLALLLVVLYLGRLIILDPHSPVIAIPGVVSGFIVNPLWYIWLSAIMWRGGKKASSV